ncbi:MAG: PAS domain-containing protein, partial [Bdellovibrionia bacterium]
MKRVEPQVTSQTGGKNNSKVFSSVPDAIRLGLFLAFSALLIICERTRRLSNYAATQQKELQLSQLEQRYFDLVRVMIVALAPDETVIKINKKGCEILGYRPEEIIGKNWFDTCVPEESRNEIRKVFQDLLGTEPQNAESYQNPVITKTGEERIIEWRNTTFYNPDTKKIIVLCAGEDITEYIKTNAALRESEAKFRSLADDALVGIFMVQDWHYIFANKYLAEILGYSVEELLNLENWIDVVAPDERPIATMTVEGMLSDKQSQRREIRLQRKDGKLIDVDGISALTEYDGKPALIGTVVDITEKKALERQKEDFFAMATHDL